MARAKVRFSFEIPEDNRPEGRFVSADPSGSAFARHISHTDLFTGEVTQMGIRTVGPQRVPWNDRVDPLPTTLHPRKEDDDG